MFDGKYFDWNQKRIKGIVDYYGYKFFYGKKMADLGCGHADMSGVLYRLGSDITAVDARQEHLKIVSKKFPGIKTVKANLDGPWPFHGQKFDMVLDLGLMCHLANFETHLKLVCASTTYLVLETAVCDSSDPHKSIPVPEAKEVYDLSYNGMGCRPSVAAIERVLAECNMGFKRFDNPKFNSSDYVYDWVTRNDDSTSIDKRRIWFACKNDQGVTTTYNNSQPVVLVQPASSTVFTPPIQSVQLVNSVPQNLRTTASPRPPMIPAPPRSNRVDDRIRFSVFKSNKPRFLYLSKRYDIEFSNALRRMGVSLTVFDFESMLAQTRNTATVQTDFLYLVKQTEPQFINMDTSIMEEVVQEAHNFSPGVLTFKLNDTIRKNIMESKNLDITYDQLKGLLIP